MKLRDCQRDLNHVVMTQSPLRERAPEHWQEASRSQIIPESLFRFYVNANYFSPDKAPPFLTDADKILFSYLGTLIECIQENLSESHDLHNDIKNLGANVYNPLKKAQGEHRDPNANKKQRRALRSLLLNLSSVLDLLAEVHAVLFPRSVKNLKPGRALFSTLRRWLENPLEAGPTPNLLVTPQAHYLRLFHSRIAPLIPRSDSEQDWLSLFTLYRNKLTHFGALSFMDFRLHDKSGDFFSFLPRNWPFIWQQHLSWRDDSKNKEHPPIFDHIEENCIHIDLAEFLDGSHKRVFEIIDQAFLILLDAYDSFKEFQPSVPLLEDLLDSRKVFSFVDFDS